MVEYSVAYCTITPVRREPSESSEQLTQLLFGELCEVLDHLPRWTKIRSTLDQQEGWVDFKMLTPANPQEMKSEEVKVEGNLVVATPMAIATSIETGEELVLTMGTRLPNYAHGTFEVLGKQYLIDPTEVKAQSLEAKREDVCALALTLLNAPYLWGGKNAMGIDCSGFTQVVYSVFGVNLLRNAREQITQGEVVASLDEAQAGDLAFFDHADRNPQATNISHVGLLLDNKKIIHCSGYVRVDDIDAMGIHLPDGELTHHLVAIRRYL